MQDPFGDQVAPGRSDGSWRIGEMPGTAAIEVPFTRFGGASDGPRVWIVAARDGDEVHATLAALTLRDRLADEEMAGEVIVIPIANPPAFGVHQRSHPLGPSFLGDRVDGALRAAIVRGSGHLIDIHSAGLDADTIDWVLYRREDEEAASMAAALGFPIAYAHVVGADTGGDGRLLDGALFTQASAAGVPAILVESGGGLPPDPRRIDGVVAGIWNVLGSLGIVGDPPEEPAAPRALETFRIVTSSRGGFLETLAALGDPVEAGDVLGVVRDVVGRVVEELTSPIDGIVLTSVLNPAVGTGTWAFEIGG